jgi:hypothetical protein
MEVWREMLGEGREISGEGKEHVFYNGNRRCTLEIS